MSRIKRLEKSARGEGRRFARRREDRRLANAAIEEQRAWWHTAWSKAAAAAKTMRRTISVRQEKAGLLEEQLGVGVELVPSMSTVRRPRYGTPEWVHQHNGAQLLNSGRWGNAPYRNPDRVERLRRNGRLRTDIDL